MADWLIKWLIDCLIADWLIDQLLTGWFYDCGRINIVDDADSGGYASGGDDVELLAVDSPLRTNNHGRRPRRVGGILRLLSSDDDVRDNDDALLSLEQELTQSMLPTCAVYLSVVDGALPPLPSNTQHVSYDVCLEVRGEIIRTVLCCIVYWSCAQS